MDHGGLVYFKKSEEQLRSEKENEGSFFVGHPDNQEWFCKEHFEKARSVNYMTRKEALAVLTIQDNLEERKDA